MNWHLFGLNPSFKDYIEKHSDKTMIGLSWALYWRLFAFILGIELLAFLAMLSLSLAISLFR